MKLKLITLCTALLIAIPAHAASRKITVKEAGSFAGCSTVTTLPNASFVYKNSAPVRNARGVMTGLRYEPTLIMKKKVSAGSTTIFSSKGVKIGSCPKTSAHGFAGGRFRCTMQTAALRRSAVKSGSPKVFFTLGGGQCAAVPDAGRCYGSVKGGCNRLIK